MQPAPQPKLNSKAIVTAVCRGCEQDKAIHDYYYYAYTTSSGARSTRRTSICKICSNKKRKRQRESIEVKLLEAKKRAAWRAANSERIKNYNKQRQQDAQHRANKAKAQRIRKARIRANSTNNDTRIKEIYAAAVQLQEERKRNSGSTDPMDWMVHVDHIIPLCLGGTHDADNLQILSARDNLAKGGKYPPCCDDRFVVLQ